MSAKDKNYYWNEQIDERPEIYSRFLKEGDFEKYQPDTELIQGSLEHFEKSLEAQREYTRSLWILNRYTKYGSKDWYYWNVVFQIANNTLISMENASKILSKVKSDFGEAAMKDIMIQELPEIMTPCETIPQENKQ